MNQIKTNDKSTTNHVPINKGSLIYQNEYIAKLDSNTPNANEIPDFLGDSKHEQTII